MDKKKMVIIDANSLLNRAFYALPPMVTSNGQPTGAVYGFTTMLYKILNEIKPDYIAAAFDRKAPTFRHVEFEDYKAGRRKMPKELAEQFEPVKEILRAFNIGIFELDGYEADDILGTISKNYESENMEVIIFTGDKDALQLVSEYTKVMITKKGISDIDVYTNETIMEKYGFMPENIVDLKGLMGDSSDNLPGVAGVGEKTAIKLLKEFKTLEGVYQNLDKVSGKKLKENLIACRHDAFLSKKLAAINREVPLEVDIETLRTEDADQNKLREIFLRLEFKSLLNRIEADGKVENSTKVAEIQSVAYIEDVENIIREVREKGVLNYVLIRNEDAYTLILESGEMIEEKNIIKLGSIIEDEKIVKNTFGSKNSYIYFMRQGIPVKNVEFDVEIAAYLLNPSESKYDASELIYRYLGERVPEANNSKVLTEMASLVNNLEKLRLRMMEELENHGMMRLFKEVELPLAEVLAAMEVEGFKVEKETLRQIGFELSEEIDSLTGQIFDMAGEEFNINSPKQLGVILFDKLKLPVIKKTKTGYSTNAEVLEELSSKHPIVDKILTYRQLVKLKSTYIDGLLNSVNEDGRIHSSFNQTVTATGRISSTEPNLQNIPIKMEQGRRIRKAFVPTSEEYVILSADYSQIELRVLADISKDENLIDAFMNGQDIHRRTAAEVAGIPMEEVTPQQRSSAKAVNFGIVYGLSDFGLSRDLKIPIKEAKRYIESYFERYTGVKSYMERAISTAKDKGYVVTLLNRIRYIPEINSTNRMIRALGERLAMNTPIQGSAADIIKIAMVNVYNRLKREELKSKLILQVHDELVLEVYRKEIDKVKALVKEEMENALELSVPLVVDINVGETWYEAK